MVSSTPFHRFAIALVVATLSISCSGGSTRDQGAATSSSTSAADPSTTAAPTTSASTTSSSADSVARSTGVWLGGNPVQWARDTCLATGTADVCADFPASVTWRTLLATCLRSNGLDLAIEGENLAAPLARNDPAITTRAWTACRHVYATATGAPPEYVDRTLFSADCMATKGWVSVLSVPVLSGGPASQPIDYVNDVNTCQPPDPRQTVVRCLRTNGATVSDIATPTGPTALAPAPPSPAQTTRGDPVVTAKAWAACRDTYITASGMPTPNADAYLAFPDCMATKGWLIVAMSGPPADMQAYTTDSQACRGRVAPSDPRIKVTQCLRANGIDIADVSTGASGPAGGAGSGPTGGASGQQTSTRYNPETATKAWAACRSIYITATGMPEGIADSSLATPDCMATKGWLIVVMNGPPVDTQGYSSAMSECSAAGGRVPPTTRPGPQRYPTVTAWVECFRANGVPVTDPSGGTQSGTPQVFAAATVSSAFKECVGQYGGILERAPPKP